MLGSGGGRGFRLQVTPSTGCPGRDTWQRSWRKAAEKVEWLVRLTSQPCTGLSRPNGKGPSATGQEGDPPTTQHTPSVGAPGIPWGQPSPPAWSPASRVVLERRELWTWVQIQLPYLPAATLGHTHPFSGPEHVPRAYHVLGIFPSAFSETYGAGGKAQRGYATHLRSHSCKRGSWSLSLAVLSPQSMLTSLHSPF